MAKESNPISPSDDWQIEEDLRTLCRAKEIENDAKRMKACRDMARKKMVEMGSIASDTDG
jgi:hypothetical protein